jgi:hypothetical protein
LLPIVLPGLDPSKPDTCRPIWSLLVAFGRKLRGLAEFAALPGLVQTSRQRGANTPAAKPKFTMSNSGLCARAWTHGNTEATSIRWIDTGPLDAFGSFWQRYKTNFASKRKCNP